MMASFDDVMAEHIRRINNQETYDHYLEPEIQNELIKQMLSKVSNVTNDPKTKSESNSLVCHGIGDYEFILSLVIWYDILVHTNMVSKSLQSINTNLQISTKLGSLFNALVLKEPSEPSPLSSASEISTISGLVTQVCGAIWNRLKDKCMPQPSLEMWLEITNKFETFANVLNCICAVDVNISD
ncbi:hypothetical protein QTP88_009057 [Uroleucon formosanum]